MTRRPIPEQVLLDNLAAFVGWRYDKDNPRFPIRLPGLKTPMGPPKQTDCVSFVTGLIYPSAAQVETIRGWNAWRLRQAQIAIKGHPWGPLEALVDLGLAEWRDVSEGPVPWTVVQGWEDPDTYDDGHALIIPDVSFEPEGLLETKVLWAEANYANGLDIRDEPPRSGVGFRRVAMLDGGALPVGWHEHSRCPTWRDVLGFRRHVRCVALHVDRGDEAQRLFDMGTPANYEKPPESGGSTRA